MLRDLIDPQVALLLLRSCLGMAKLVYCWRTTEPAALDAASSVLTAALTSVLRWIVVGDGPRFGPFQLQLASLPVTSGGLGITLPDDLTKYAFLSSLMDTRKLQADIFPSLPDNASFTQPLFDSFAASLGPSELI
jgi:hypothetical protein